jgi:Na+/glutamate symporter
LEHKEIGPIFIAHYIKIDPLTITTTTTTTTNDNTESTNISDLLDTHYMSHINKLDNNTDSNTNTDTNNIMDPINTNTLITTITTITITTTTTTIIITAIIKQYKEILFPVFESILFELTDLLPVNKVTKKKKIINDDNINSEEENKE